MKTFLLLTVLLATFVVRSITADPTAWPGRSCADDSSCDATITGLWCVAPNQECQCAGDKTFYFGSLNRCVIPVFKPCTAVDTDLTPNSECAVNNVVCKTGFIFNTNGRCVVPPNVDCIVDTDCDEDNLLTCEATTSKKCECSSGSVLENGQCKLVLDMPCRPPQPFPTKECRRLSQCQADRCQCNDGLVGNPEGACIVDYGGSCDNGGNTPCNENAFQVCVNGVCGCHGEGAGTWYDGSKCVLLAGAECDAAENAQSCVERSSCIGDINDVCRCDAGYAENSAHHCKLPLNAACDPAHDECNPLGFQKCNGTTGSGVCVCGNPNSIVDKNGDCRLKAGSTCEVGSGSQPCVAFAVCTGSGVCTCDAGLIATSTGECASDYGAPCFPGQVECSPDKFLTCTSHLKCDCESNSWYNEGSCELLVDEVCDVYPGSQRCTHNSTCDGNTKICTCDSGLIPSEDRKSCIETVGAPCTSDEMCNKDKYLLCVEGKCSCNENSWFNPKSARCELLAGQPCINNPDSQSCTDFSICEGNRGDSTCNCLDGYEESFDGKCVASFGAHCGQENDAECNADEFLICTEGKCSCNSNSWFNPHTVECQLLANEPCKSGEKVQKCTDFSTCKESGNGKLQCVCDADYISTNDGQCAKTYGSPCKGSDDECADFLVCEAKICSCNYNAWYNNNTARCELFAGEYCTPGSGHQACTEYSACNRGNSGGGYACNCLDGFHLSADSRCVHNTCAYSSMHGMFQRKRQ